MSSVARSARTRRGRVMLVGDLPDFVQITPHLAQPPVRVRNLFEAVGEISVAPAGQPIATILLPDRALSAAGTKAIDALRKVDPGVRIILIARSAATAAECGDRGFDACIIAPVRPEDLKRLFDDDQLLPGSPTGGAWELAEGIDETTDDSISSGARADATDRREAQAAPTASQSVPPAGAATCSAERVTPAAIEAAGPGSHDEDRASRAQHDGVTPHSSGRPSTPRHDAPESHEVAPSPASAQSSPPPMTIVEGLGDVDLLDAMQAGSEQLRRTALRIIVQQTGWSDVTLVNDEASATSPHASQATSIEVAHNGQAFGRLVSSQASATALKPWADWLARWLAFDCSHQQCRARCYQDELTGAWNRRYFNEFLNEAIARAGRSRRPLSLMVFDIDNFKLYNDRFGHEAGDEILCETVRLLQSVIRQGDRVCRIGGDEFVVIFSDPEGPRAAGSHPPETVEAIAKRFQDQVCAMRFPKLGVEAPGTLSISAGLATYPWDGADAVSLLRHADQLALESKRRGKNALTLGPGARAHCQNKRPSCE